MFLFRPRPISPSSVRSVVLSTSSRPFQHWSDRQGTLQFLPSNFWSLLDWQRNDWIGLGMTVQLLLNSELEELLLDLAVQFLPGPVGQWLDRSDRALYLQLSAHHLSSICLSSLCFNYLFNIILPYKTLNSTCATQDIK